MGQGIHEPASLYSTRVVQQAVLSCAPCCAVWVLGNMIPFWFLLKVCGLLRATADEEALGLDSSHHVSISALPHHAVLRACAFRQL